MSKTTPNTAEETSRQRSQALDTLPGEVRLH